MRAIRVAAFAAASLIASSKPQAQSWISGGAPPLMMSAPTLLFDERPSAEDAIPYRLKTADVFVPPGAKPGSISRMIRPFGSWTLICDSNASTRQRICNASQTFIDTSSKLLFSWSLAATKGGAPVFIVRVPSGGAPARLIHLTLANKNDAGFDLSLTRCDDTTCIGFIEVTKSMQVDIQVPTAVEVTYNIGNEPVSIKTSLDGLSAAIKSIR